MNLFKKTTATVALVTLVSGIFSAGVSANSTTEVAAANALAAAGYINNHSDDTAAYNLNQNVLRQEIAAVAVGLAGLEKKSSCDNVFDDVSATTPNTWACYSVEALADAGLIAKNPKFNPEAKITKAEAVAMMVKAAFPNYAYDAANSASWQEQVVSFAVENGVVASFSNYDTPATRGFVFEAGNEAMVATSEVITEECDAVEELLGLCGTTEEVTTEEETTTEEEATTEETTTPVVSADNVVSVELSPETPTDAFVAGGKDRTNILAFDVTAGSEDATLKELTLEYTGLSNASDITKIAVYLGNDQISKGSTKKFDSDNELELYFENGTVIKAGETQTLFVTANVSLPTSNVSHKITLTDFVTTSAVEAASISSVSFNVVNASNSAAVTLDASADTTTLNVGEIDTLAEFSLEETSDKENAIVKSITFGFAGFDAEDDLYNVSLYADNVEIASNLSVNSDDEVIANLDFAVPADEKIDFELKGTINDITTGVTVKITDLYIVGEETEVIATITEDFALDATVNTIAVEGSEINVSFDKSDIDEVKPNSDKNTVGTLHLTSTSDYTIDRLVVKVETTTSGALEIIKTMELDGVSEDGVYTTEDGTTDSAESDTTAYYSFEDISLNNESKDFDITFDVNDSTTFNGESLTFSVSIIKVTDEEENEDAVLAKVLSTNSLDDKTIDITTASLTLTETAITENDLVLGNGVEVVLYKGNLNIGDADDVEIDKMTFTGSLKMSSGVTITEYDYEDILDTVTLNIGGKTFDADINGTNVKFTSMNAIVAAGSNNVEVLLTAKLKDTDDVNTGDELVLNYINSGAIDAEDSDGEDLNSITVNQATEATTIVLNEAGSLDFAVVNNGDNKDEIVDVVLAGTNSVALAEVELEAKEEDIKIQELVFTMSGVDLSTTIKNVKLMNGSSVLADDAVITYVAGDTTVLSGSVAFTGTVVTFENDFVIEDSSNEIQALLVADLETITDEGGTVSALNGGEIAIDLTSVEAKGVSSNDDIYPNEENEIYLTSDTVTSTAVKVVPALVTISIDNTLGSNDKEAKITFTVDRGDNSLDDDTITVISITTEDAISASGMTVRNDEGVTIVDASTGTGHTLAGATAADYEIVNGDEYTLKVVADNEEVRIAKYGISYKVGSTTGFTIVNDSITDLGEYDAD